MKKQIRLYRLTDARGEQRITVVNDLADSGCIGGYGANGQYQQYDSCKLYYAYEWAEKHGMKLQYATMELDIPDEIFH